MKRVYTLALAVLFIATSGCTFFTEIEADVNTSPDDESSSSCDSLFIMLEAERDPDMRAELAAAYARCIEDNEPGDNNVNPNPCDEGSSDMDEECHPVPHPCDEGEVSEDGRCVSNPHPCDDETDADCQPEDPEPQPPSEECRFIENNADIIEDMTDEELLDACEQSGLEYEECIDLIEQCLAEDEDGNEDGEDHSTIPTCQDAYDALLQFQADPNDISESDAFDLCVQYGSQTDIGALTDRQCQRLAQACFPLDGNSEGDPDDSESYCESVIQLVEAEGYMVPLEEETADQLYNDCVQNLADVQQCERFRQCVI